MTLEVRPITDVPEVAAGDDLVSLLGDAVAGMGAADGDVIVITQKVVSKAEGRIVRGGGGLQVGEPVRVVLLATDPRRGYIDFATDADR